MTEGLIVDDSDFIHFLVCVCACVCVYVRVCACVCGGADHNQYIHHNYIWQSNYCAGLRVLNITDDMKLTEVQPVLTVYSLTHLYICSFTCTLTHSLTHSLTHTGGEL